MISDLQAMTEAELKKLSATQLIDHILQERSTSTVTKQVGDSRGMLEYVVEHRDYKGNLTGSCVTVTAYHEDGTVDTVCTVDYTATGLPKHFREVSHDGQQTWLSADCAIPYEEVAPVSAVVLPAESAKTEGIVFRVVSTLKSWLVKLGILREA